MQVGAFRGVFPKQPFVFSLSQLVDTRTNTIITKTDALNALVDTRTTTIIGQNNLALKVRIQQALVEPSAGGYLDAQPIGVTTVVNRQVS